jgi:hypothetical protein
MLTSGERSLLAQSGCCSIYDIAKRAKRADQPQPEPAHRVILGDFAIDWAERNCTISIVLHLRSLAPSVFSSSTADVFPRSQVSG